MGRNRKKLPGHYCWCCGRQRANGRFSNRGRRMHVCKDCMKLGAEELAYRQVVRNIDRLLTWDGIIRRKCRAVLQRYLSHHNLRVLEYANKVWVISSSPPATRELCKSSLTSAERTGFYTQGSPNWRRNPPNLLDRTS